jgi:hypothetical protein
VAHAQIDAQEFAKLKTEVAEIFEAWPNLPLALRGAVLAIVRSSLPK